MHIAKINCGVSRTAKLCASNHFRLMMKMQVIYSIMYTYNERTNDMPNNLKAFEIRELYGIKDYRIELDNNRVIIVGENGCGKTTIFRMMYYALSCNWLKLRTFEFHSMKLYFDSDEIFISYDMLNEMENPEKFVIKFKDIDSYKKNLIRFTKNEDNQFYFEFNDDNGVQKIEKRIEKAFNTQILYLPTYRRIEEELKKIYPKANISENNIDNSRSIELIKFGMQDVCDAIKTAREQLMMSSQKKQNNLISSYLGDVVNKEYETINTDIIKNLDQNKIESVLNRKENIMSDKQINKVRKTIEFVKDGGKLKDHHSKLICHYFLKLYDFHEDIKNEESNFEIFCSKCNKYLINNRIVYDGSTFDCNVYNLSDNEELCHEISFQDLSSGEKQIVSIFSHLNLVQKENIMVFIDEPELSLSVEWQREFLPDIINSKKTVGLVATTHSPFIFENDLECYVHGLGEFAI